MTHTKLSSIVATPANKLIRVLDENKASVLDCYRLLDPHSTLVLDLLLLGFLDQVVNVDVRVFD